MSLVNLISVTNFRNVVPVSPLVDDSIISSAINHAQISLIPYVTSWEFYNSLISNLSSSSLTPLQVAFLKVVEPALACFSAYHLVPLAANQIHPVQLVDAQPLGSPQSLQHYYLNQTSSYLHPVYSFCESNLIPFNIFKSTSFCNVVLGGYYR